MLNKIKESCKSYIGDPSYVYIKINSRYIIIMKKMDDDNLINSKSEVIRNNKLFVVSIFAIGKPEQQLKNIMYKISAFQRDYDLIFEMNKEVKFVPCNNNLDTSYIDFFCFVQIDDAILSKDEIIISKIITPVTLTPINVQNIDFDGDEENIFVPNNLIMGQAEKDSKR
jgi:hypothetical protein